MRSQTNKITQTRRMVTSGSARDDARGQTREDMGRAGSRHISSDTSSDAPRVGGAAVRTGNKAPGYVILRCAEVTPSSCGDAYFLKPGHVPPIRSGVCFEG